MHLAVEPRLAHDLGAVRLQRAAVVVEADAGHAADQPVRDPRRQAPDEAVLPVPPPAADDVVALVDLLEQRARCRRGRSAGRRPSGRSTSPRAWSKPGRHRRRLAVVPAQLDELQARIVARRAARAARYVSSRLPSSTTMISYVRPSASSAATERRRRAARRSPPRRGPGRRPRARGRFRRLGHTAVRPLPATTASVESPSCPVCGPARPMGASRSASDRFEQWPTAVSYRCRGLPTSTWRP